MTVLPTLAILSLATLATCEAPVDDPEWGTAESAIIGGTSETGYPAVGALLLGGGWSGSGICSGTLISPRVVLTAAHCVKGESPSAFILGPDWDKGQQLAVQTWEANPAWEPEHPETHYGNTIKIGWHDVGVVVLKNPAPVEPMPFRTQSMDNMGGMFVSYVGYGKTTTNKYTSSDVGKKNRVLIQIADVWDQGFINIVDTNEPTRNTCGGDSGGPAFLKLGGVEQIAGLVSSGDEDCKVMGYSTRVDTNAEWIGQMLAKYDPSFKPATCGNGMCDGGETVSFCPQDCKPPIVCGNGQCEQGEDTASCAQDCPPPGPVCGNGQCEQGEDTASCAQDCPPPAPVCGNGQCEQGEDTASCAQDCPASTAVCGDGQCDDGEDCNACAADCGECPVTEPVCGDGQCDEGEDCNACAADCGECPVTDPEVQAPGGAQPGNGGGCSAGAMVPGTWAPLACLLLGLATRRRRG